MVEKFLQVNNLPNEKVMVLLVSVVCPLRLNNLVHPVHLVSTACPNNFSSRKKVIHIQQGGLDSLRKTHLI